MVREGLIDKEKVVREHRPSKKKELQRQKSPSCGLRKGKGASEAGGRE